MKTDTIWIEKLFTGGYEIRVRKNKHCAWEFVGYTPHWNLVYALAHAAQGVFFGKVS